MSRVKRQGLCPLFTRPAEVVLEQAKAIFKNTKGSLGIFEEAMKDRQSGRRTLARAARTCTAWNGPAYDISWRDTNLVLALQVLAPMTMIEEEDFEELRPQHKLRYHFTRPLTLLDWIRFESIAQRVRTLHAENLDPNIPGLNLSETLMQELRDTKPPGHEGAIFPRVVTLYWGDGHTIHPADFFISPNLTRLSLSIKEVKRPEPPVERRANRFEQFLAWAEAHHIDLDTIEQDEYAEILAQALPLPPALPPQAPVNPATFPYNTYIADLGPFLERQAKLVRLTVKVAVAAPRARVDHLLRIIAAHETLEKLDLTFTREVLTIPWSPHDVNEQALFPRLKKMAITSLMAGRTADLIRCAGPARLEELVISEYDGSYSPQHSVSLEQLIDAAVSHYQARTIRLRDLRYDLARYERLNAFRDCVALENLEIQSHGTLVLTDDELRDLVSNLPVLKSLVVDGTRRKNNVAYEPRLSLAALGIVVSHCLFIQHISLDIDGSEVPTQAVAGQTSSETLESIALGYSYDRPICDSRAVALYLSNLSSYPPYGVTATWKREKTGTMYDLKWDQAVRWAKALTALPASDRAEAVGNLV